MGGPDPNPWRRLLALPNESRTKTLLVAFLVAGVCALLVSAATVVLRPIKTANRAAEERLRIERLVSGVPGMAPLLAESGGELSSVIVDLDAGRAARDVGTENLDAALADPMNWTALDASADLAEIGQRPDYARVFLLRDGEDVSLVLLPMTGSGYGGRIDAILALHGDGNTVAGIAITGHAETPGLGARIEEASWQASFPGTEVRSPDGQLRFQVARGDAASPYEVDGITGATRTGRGITRMVRFWLGAEGYGPFLRAIARGEF